MLHVGVQTMTTHKICGKLVEKMGRMELRPAPQNITAKTKDDEDVMYVLWQQQLHSFLFPSDIQSNHPHSYHSVLHIITMREVVQGK